MAERCREVGKVLRDGSPLCAKLAPHVVADTLGAMEECDHDRRIEYEEHFASWRNIELEIRHCRNWLPTAEAPFVTQHIEIRSAEKRLLPITETGYRSHFLNGADALAEFEHDPVAFVLWWLDEAAKDPSWQQREFEDRQGSLF